MEEDIDKLIYDNISEINYKIIYKKSHDDWFINKTRPFKAWFYRIYSC
jgi:hypothetical protein